MGMRAARAQSSKKPSFVKKKTSRLRGMNQRWAKNKQSY
jgi:hypothetical protein